MGTTRSTISRWESGESTPSPATLNRLIGACGLDLRIALAQPDPAEASLIERNLQLTPTERLDQLVRTVAFIRAGRAALARRRGAKRTA